MPRHPRLLHSRICTGTAANVARQRPSRKVVDNLFLLHAGPIRAADPFAEFDATMCHMWADQMKAALREAARDGVVLYWADDEEMRRHAYDDEGTRAITTPRGAFLAVARVYGCCVWLAESAMFSEDDGDRWALLDATRACAVIATRPPCLIRFDVLRHE